MTGNARWIPYVAWNQVTDEAAPTPGPQYTQLKFMELTDIAQVTPKSEAASVFRNAIGSQLAIALITTFYGVLLANLLFKPIAVKLERRTEQRLVLMNMVLEGISMMCAGRSPSMMRETLKAFVAQYDDEIYDGGGPKGPATGARTPHVKR